MDQEKRYQDRTEAGRELADVLKDELPDPGDAIVLGLPRGGVPVAYEVARALDLPLDLIVVRKLGFPDQPELAMGAIASGDIRVMNERVSSMGRVDDETVEKVEEEEREELERREEAYRGDRSRPDLDGRTVILVDDGVATGSTAEAAIQAVRTQDPAEIVLAVPVSSPESASRLSDEADRVICPLQPEAFAAIGSWYQEFSQVSDDEVRSILEQAWEEEGLTDEGG